MAQRGRPGLSSNSKLELWKRWREGQSLSDIGRALGKPPGSIHGVIAASGGISPRERTRRTDALELAEREEVSRGLAEGRSIRAIAGRLDRAPSTVSREIRRNGGRKKYRAARADERAWEHAKRPKPSLLEENAKLKQLVAEKLEADWSPQQIAGWLLALGNRARLRISHETIYRSLYVQTRGVLKRELAQQLRSGRTMRKGKRSSTKNQRRGQIIDAVSIRDRPAHIENRIKPGHWEGDLIAGAKNSHVATLV